LPVAGLHCGTCSPREALLQGRVEALLWHLQPLRAGLGVVLPQRWAVGHAALGLALASRGFLHEGGQPAVAEEVRGEEEVMVEEEREVGEWEGGEGREGGGREGVTEREHAREREIRTLDDGLWGGAAVVCVWVCGHRCVCTCVCVGVGVCVCVCV
jgi:hypothetical protein